MIHLLAALGWGVCGAAAGFGIARFCRWQALAESERLRHAGEAPLELTSTRWEQWLPVGLTAVFFAAIAYTQAGIRMVGIDSIYALILVQILVFDLKHRYILDVVVLPACGLALGLSFLTPWSAGAWPAANWTTAVVAGAISGAAFLILFFGGVWLLGQEAFGFGDVKLAVFIGLSTGLSDFRMVHALLAGVYLGGAAAILLLITRRARLRQAVPYAPFLVAGTALTLLLQKP
jgi:leader peptidase (prepilin peptidase)/N-methyltransferase